VLCGKRANHPSVWIGIGILLLVLSYLFIVRQDTETLTLSFLKQHLSTIRNELRLPLVMQKKLPCLGAVRNMAASEQEPDVPTTSRSRASSTWIA